MRRRIVRACAVCGHLMNIFLGKGGRVPKKIGFFDSGGKEIFGEYWECAICMSPNGE